MLVIGAQRGPQLQVEWIYRRDRCRRTAERTRHVLPLRQVGLGFRDFSFTKDLPTQRLGIWPVASFPMADFGGFIVMIATANLFTTLGALAQRSEVPCRVASEVEDFVAL